MAFPRYRRFLGASYSNPRKGGQLAAEFQGASRGQLLARLMQQGKMKQSDLSAPDLAAAAPLLDKKLDVDEPGGGGKSVFGLLGNLGSNIWETTKGLPAGLFTMGKAGVSDVVGAGGNPLKVGYDVLTDNDSELREQVIDPTIEGYKYTYAGKGAPEGQSFWDRVYEDPLGPVLDAASVVSLGAGSVARAGSAASRAGKIAPDSRLARLGSTKREPLRDPVIDEENMQPGLIEREYSTRPLRKGLQVLTDKSTNLPVVGSRIGDLQRNLTRHQGQKLDFSIKESQVLHNIANEAVKPLQHLFKNLDADELQAFQLIGHRVNTPERIAQLEKATREGLEGTAPEGQRFEDFAGSTDRSLPESRTDFSPRSKELATDPTKSERLMAVLSGYEERTRSLIEPDLEADAITAKRNEVLDALAERFPTQAPESPLEMTPADELSRQDYNRLRRYSREDSGDLGKASTGEGIYTEDLQLGIPDSPSGAGNLENLVHPFEQGFIMPTQIAADYKPYRPGKIARALLGREDQFIRQGTRSFSPSTLTYQNLFQEPYIGFRPNADAALAGVTRPDARQFIDFLAKHQRDKIEQAFSQETLARVAMKKSDGETLEIPGSMTPEQVRAKYGDDWVAVSPVYPWHFFNKEMTAAQAVAKLHEAGLDFSEISARMGAEALDTAIDSTLIAQRTKNVLVPRDFAEYQRKLENASAPYENKAGRIYARGLNTWRTYTLAMMPRWALNTAVGSFVLATVKGISPRQYTVAEKLRRGGEFGRDELAGVNLGNVIQMELLESGFQGHLDQMFGIKGPGVFSRGIMQKVQSIEDHFRRASFVQSLDRRAKIAMNEQGAIISNLERAKGPRTTEEYIDFIENNPEAVRAAIEDVNRFSYNFATLGPLERRYVRQAIPFWGWYKFISGLAYRLPVDYPGRTNVLAQIGMLGAAANEQQLGLTPDWIKGALPLSYDKESGQLQYLSTMGLNPFSQIFNPATPEGALTGTLQLGQGSPLIQSLLSAYGLDTLRGGQVPVSPEAGVSPDFFGALIDLNRAEKGQWAETDPGSVMAPRRFLAGLVRSFPQARIMERYNTEGRSVYPESLPWDVKPMPTKPESRFGGDLGQVMEQIIGVAPRPYQLGDAQRLMKKRIRYARTRNKRDLRVLKRNLQGP